jgi:hypothetical protein
VTLVALSSALLGVAVVASRIALARLGAQAPRDPHAYWMLGLLTPLPAWLVAFVSLLGSQPGVKPQAVGSAAWVLSAAAALIGVIATEARVRGMGDLADAHQAPRLWWLGVLAVLPSWVIALGGHLIR